MRRSVSRGVAALEFALVLPLLLLFLLGAIDWGWFFYSKQVATSAAREGARAGSIAPEASASAEAESAARGFLAKAGFGSAAATVAVVATSASVEITVGIPTGSITGFNTSLVPATAGASAAMRR